VAGQAGSVSDGSCDGRATGILTNGKRVALECSLEDGHTPPWCRTLEGVLFASIIIDAVREPTTNSGGQMPDPNVVTHEDTESGFKIKIADVGNVNLELTIKDHVGVELYYQASKLGRPLSDWTGGGFHGEKRGFVMAQVDQGGSLDKSVAGAWVLAPFVP
jgi:hypothetical protein